MSTKFFRPIVLVLVWWTISAAPVLADNGREGQQLIFTWENDAVSGSDRHYTQGAKIAYWSDDDRLTQWMQRLSARVPAWGYEVRAQKWGLALGQEIYTPEDLNQTALLLHDRPYAGWLYGSFSLQRRGPTRHASARETFQLDLGVVGPESLAEETQKTWHGVQPLGWGNQLKIEPGVVLRYERSYRFRWQAESSPWSADLLPQLGAGVGNVETYLSLGSAVRLGFNVPDEFAVSPEKQSPPFGIFFSAGLDGRWVLRNVFLDGNTFHGSHRVRKHPVVADLKVGCTLVFRRVELNVSHIFRTHEFYEQIVDDSFSSASVAFKF